MIEVRCQDGMPVRLGVVRAFGLASNVFPPSFEERLAAAMARCTAQPGEEEERVRAAARDMLRNGGYKPTGRGKPASEYLVRSAVEGAFPRINPAVDVCNLVSLESLLPISLWDMDKAGTSRFLVRLGRAGESYVFNAAGQVIDVEDLVVGCRVPFTGPESGEPIVNPVKDSLATKTDASTRNIAAVIYAPLSLPVGVLAAVTGGFADLLAHCGTGVDAGWAIAGPGETTRP